MIIVICIYLLFRTTAKIKKYYEPSDDRDNAINYINIAISFLFVWIFPTILSFGFLTKMLNTKHDNPAIFLYLLNNFFLMLIPVILVPVALGLLYKLPESEKMSGIKARLIFVICVTFIYLLLPLYFLIGFLYLSWDKYKKEEVNKIKRQARKEKIVANKNKKENLDTLNTANNMIPEN